MIEQKENKLSPGEIGLNVKDTGFLLSVLNRVSIPGSELKLAMAVTTKIEQLHEYIVNKEEIIRGVH